MDEEYIDLCRIIGPCIDLVQANGGNISIKSDNTIIIKQSGFVMANTTYKNGYVKCDLEKVRNKFSEKNEDCKDTIIDLVGDETPSIELFFHLLPKKYIVHLHPLKLLLKLSSTKCKEYFPNCIPYFKPGIQLSEYILENYKNEDILYLQNHGIIICVNTIEEVYQHLNIIKDINFIKYLYEKFDKKYIIKESVNKYAYHFFNITPDFCLYLTNKLSIVYDSDNVEKLLDEYIKDIIPTTIYYNDTIYCIGKSYSKVLLIDEMFYSYNRMMQMHGISDSLNELSYDNIFELFDWDKEKKRLQ